MSSSEEASWRFHRYRRLVDRLGRPGGSTQAAFQAVREEMSELARGLGADIVSFNSQGSRGESLRRRTWQTAVVQAREIATRAWATARDLPLPLRVEVVASAPYAMHHAGCQDGAAAIGKVVEIRYGGSTAWVREDYDVALSFFLPSNARVGLKTHGPSRTWEVLALCAPTHQWNAIARAVARLDGLQRRVVRNRNFTPAWARRVLAYSRETGRAATRSGYASSKF